MRPRMTFPRGRRRPLILPLLVLGLALALAAPAQAAPEQAARVGTIPLSFTVVSPCTGEAIALEGVVHFVGGDHFRYKISGVGASGATYQVHSIDNEGSAPSPAVSVRTTAHTMRIVREGGSGDDDFTVHVTGHSTLIIATGELTADFVVVGLAKCH
jgi:hypothetical protein